MLYEQESNAAPHEGEVKPLGDIRVPFPNPELGDAMTTTPSDLLGCLF